MQKKLTRKILLEWGGASVFQEAERIVKSGGVSEAEYHHPWIRGTLPRSGYNLNSSLKILSGGTVESHCPCYINRHQGLICPHVIAVALKVLYSRTDPKRRQKYIEEQRRAKRLAAIDPSRYIQRASPEDRDAPQSELVLTVRDHWLEDFSNGDIPLGCAFRINDRLLRPDRIPPGMKLRLAKQDDALLYVLEDICEGPPTALIHVRRPDFLNILEVWRERRLKTENNSNILIHAQALETRLRLELDDSTGELSLSLIKTLPDPFRSKTETYLVCSSKSWVHADNHLWPMSVVLPLPYHALYEHPIDIQRPYVLRFIQSELSVLGKVVRLETDLSEDVFRTAPANPSLHLTLKGSPASLAAELTVKYTDEQQFPVLFAPENDNVSIPDPDDPLKYLTRNLEKEQQAMAQIQQCGFAGKRGDDLTPITGTRLVLNTLGTHVPSLRRNGWRVQLEGRIARFMEQTDVATPVVKIEEPSPGDSFDVFLSIEDPAGGVLRPAEVQRAILRGDGFVEKGDRLILLDVHAIHSMRAVFEDCAPDEGSRPGSFRLKGRYAPFVQSSLHALDGIDIEQPADWRDRCRIQNRRIQLEPVPLPDNLETILRPYQKEGVYWMRFIESAGFGGILADEMGLGKTLQALTWLRMERVDPDSRANPALIICPTSLVDNWEHEASKFTPDLKCLRMNGPQRHDHWDSVLENDLVITSYALIRRDIDKYLDIPFCAVILDEAQHIKNRSTKNAVAVKQIQSPNRFVLTGTPLENSVADLWSIMDFLMPDYMGAYETFRQNYEIPILRDDQEGDTAQLKLRRKVHPFMIRRRKKEVAADLPDKIESVSFCTLTAEQQKIYNDILFRTRDRISAMVAEYGFNHCRMEILALLMRLRQVCCHPDLLKKDRPSKSEVPVASSAKVEQFLELLDQALDSGHRLLVFSQFVGMLTILRAVLRKRDLDYCYLDGSTKDRLERVHHFNRSPDIPVFLISLKAGGTGLNLTGADMVIHFDPWWNPAVEDQATDRAHRIGQKRTVYSVKLIAEHTIEEKVLALQERKRSVIAKTIESGTSGMPRSISWDDVRELLEL